jgi:hypothetical protein
VLGIVRYGAMALVAILAVTFGGLNFQTSGRGNVLAPPVCRVEDVVALVILATLPLAAGSLHFVWRQLPAPRALKKRHVARSTAMQAAAVAFGLFATITLRPSAAPVVASAVGPHGIVGYAFRWEWGCGYRIGVSDGDYAIRGIAAVGPFDCDVPAPRIAWQGDDVALVMADGTTVGVWPTTPPRE